MTVPEELYQKALSEGFTVEAACALLGNIQGESAFRADNAEDRIHQSGISDAEYIRRADAGVMTYNGKNFIYDEVGFGYAQWTYWSRKKGLLEFCQNRARSVSDPECQKEFLFYEMKVDFPGIYKLCRESHDMTKLMRDLVYIWENPDDKAAAIRNRTPYANAWLSKFNGWAPVDSSTTPAPSIDIPKVETWPPRTICSGLNWPETYLAQSLLNCRGYQVVVNGIFSEPFEKKVKEFQLKNGLVADGIIGPKTWKVLMTM